jgi:hypothetical protein
MTGFEKIVQIISTLGQGRKLSQFQQKEKWRMGQFYTRNYPGNLKVILSGDRIAPVVNLKLPPNYQRFVCTFQVLLSQENYLWTQKGTVYHQADNFLSFTG